MEFSKEEAPNVVTEPRFRELLKEGFVAEITCHQDCHKRNGHWYGEWTMRAISSDGTQERLLVKVPRYAHVDVEPRVFKTVNGLVSFMLETGFGIASIPVLTGRRARNVTVSETPQGDLPNNG